MFYLTAIPDILHARYLNTVSVDAGEKARARAECAIRYLARQDIFELDIERNRVIPIEAHCRLR